ncbi:hypothetical protein N2152v2_000091 [Parachlorella kessleri]
MRGGIPLTDADRAPWLAELAAIIEQHCSSRQPAVLSCSALTPAYRLQLRGTQTLVTAAGLVIPDDLCLDGQAAVPSNGPGSQGGGGSSAAGAERYGQEDDCVAARHRDLCGGIGGELVACGSEQAVQRRQQQQQQHHGESLQAAVDGGGRTQEGRPGNRGAAAMPVGQPCSSLSSADEGRGRGWTEGVGFILLEPSREHLQRWVAQRAAAGAHFMPPSLLDSQLAALQYTPDELYCHVMGDPFPAPADIVLTILQQLGAAGVGCI